MSQPDPTGVQSTPGVDPQSGTGATDPTSVPPAAAPGSQPAGDKTYTQAEWDALQARMVAADRTAASKAAELKKIQDAQLSDQERKDQALKDAQAQAAALAERVTAQALENAFLKDSTYAWHNADAALKLLEREAITVGDDGKVTGMKAAIDKLAKDHAYLVKTDAGSGTPTPTPQGSTGTTGTTRQHGQGTSQAEWEKKFPAMRGRVQ